MLTIFLPLKETLVATFNKASALTSRKQVAYQGMNVQLHHKHLKFLAALHRFRFRKKSSKILTFQFFLPRKQPLVAPLSKTRPLISRRKKQECCQRNLDISNKFQNPYTFFCHILCRNDSTTFKKANHRKFFYRFAIAKVYNFEEQNF